MAKLPKAIQEEIERAEAIEAALNAQESVAEPETQNETPQTESLPVDTPQTETVAEAQDQPQADDPNSETWEHRYRVLQGKYDRDVPVLHAKVRELEAQLSQWAQRAESQPTESSPQASTDVTPEEIDTYGEDLVSLMRRVAASEAVRRQAETLDRVGRVESSLQLTAEDRFYANLTTRVPQWKDIDNEPGWLSWLGEYDPMAGSTRQDALNVAANSGDADRVASIFEAYLRTRPTAPAAANSPASLQAQVVPRGQGSNTQAAPQKRIYTQAEIARLLDPRHILRLPEDQQRAIEHDIDMAYAEGRIAA